MIFNAVEYNPFIFMFLCHEAGACKFVHFSTPAKRREGHFLNTRNNAVASSHPGCLKWPKRSGEMSDSRLLDAPKTSWIYHFLSIPLNPSEKSKAEVGRWKGQSKYSIQSEPQMYVY